MTRKPVPPYLFVFQSIFAALAFAFVGNHAIAERPTVFATGEKPNDARFGELKTLQKHFPFKVPDTAGEWFARAEKLKQRVLVSNGLWPMPERTPLNPVIHGKVEREGFTVERVYFESLPGHYVTGLLFRPAKTSDKPRPGVLSPHGHGGRQQTHSDKEIKRQVSIGAEHFTDSGSMPKLARCAQLARMGCVTFIFDMLGYADSIQIPHAVAHRHANVRPEEVRREQDDSWPFFSIDADLRLQSIMGLQTWNASRALDFLESLPDVDPDRLAVTGGSGGGTQSILLGAIDDRIKVSFPNGMVSTAMQGGCYCENCNLLRVGTGNVELAALFAPRPQAMTAADDWTRDMMKDGYPELQWLYATIGNQEDVYCRPMLHFKHNYNYVTRATMYHWMTKHLELGLDVPVIESDFKRLTDEETKVWTAEHPAPTNVGIPHEREVCGWLDDQSKKKLNGADSDKLRGPAFEVIFGVDPVPAQVGFALKEIEFVSKGKSILDGLTITKGVLQNARRGTSLPLLIVRSKSSDPNRKIVWTLGEGKSQAFDKDSRANEQLKAIAADSVVLVPDLFGQGELNDGIVKEGKQRLVNEKRSYSAFTFGYNPTLVSDRVNDLIDVMSFANKETGTDVRLLATDGSAAWATPAATFLSSKQVKRTMIDVSGFEYANVTTYDDINFVPGAVKYGDIPALVKRIPGEKRVFNATGNETENINWRDESNLNWISQ